MIPAPFLGGPAILKDLPLSSFIHFGDPPFMETSLDGTFFCALGNTMLHAKGLNVRGKERRPADASCEFKSRLLFNWSGTIQIYSGSQVVLLYFDFP